MTILAIIFMIAGLFFFTTGTIGFLRFPDFYSRMHATGKGDTLGALLSLIGVALYHLHHGFSPGHLLVSIKLLFIAIFWFLASPTATHALLRSAFESDLMPWTKDNRPVIEWSPKEEEIK